jgi:hypothetical protein
MSGLETFDALRRKLAKLPEVATSIAPKIAAMFTAEAQRAFDSGKSVHGVPFTSDSGEALDLRESGAIRSSAVRYTATGATIRASVGSVRHARYQLKHGFLPRRIPVEWQAKAAQIIDAELTKEASR